MDHGSPMPSKRTSAAIERRLRVISYYFDVPDKRRKHADTYQLPCNVYVSIHHIISVARLPRSPTIFIILFLFLTSFCPRSLFVLFIYLVSIISTYIIYYYAAKYNLLYYIKFALYNTGVAKPFLVYIYMNLYHYAIFYSIIFTNT